MSHCRNSSGLLLVLGLLLISALPAVADEPASDPAQAEVAAVAPSSDEAEAQPLPADWELPNMTPAPAPRAKNCAVQDKQVGDCWQCDTHCAQWLNCYGSCYSPYPGFLWCDCQEGAN